MKKVIFWLAILIIMFVGFLFLRGLLNGNLKSNISYGPDRQQVYDFYAPKTEADYLMVIVHGGAWVLGNKSQFSADSQFFASQGLSVINMNYRLAPKWQYDAPLEDITKVLKLVEAKRADFKLKENYKTILFGHSAGGHLVALYSLKEQDYDTRNIDYCIGASGVYNLTVTKDQFLNNKVLTSFLGDISRAEASPVNNIKTGELTKFLLINGGASDLVSADQAKNFAAGLQTKNIYAEVLVVPDRNHNTIVSKIPDWDIVAKTILSFIKK